MAKNNSKNKDSKKSDINKKNGGKGLYQPGVELKGENLRRVAKQIVKLQTQPQIKAANSQAKGIKRILSSQIASGDALAKQATKNTKNYYHNLGDESDKALMQQRALTGRLTDNVADAGADTQTAIQGAANASTGRLVGSNALTRAEAPTDAQNELQNIVAEQSSRAAREQQALQAQSQAQGADYQALQRNLGQASLLRGGSQVADIGRQALENKQALQTNAIPSLIDAKAQAASAKSSRGALMAQTLDTLRGSERDYALSKGALGIDRDQLKADVIGDKRDAKQAANQTKLQGRQTRKNTKLQGKVTGKNQRADDKRSAMQDRKDKKQDAAVEVRQAAAEARSIQAEHKSWSPERVLDEVKKGDYSQAAIRKAVAQLRKKSHSKGSAGSGIAGGFGNKVNNLW